jgi:acylphosphatase
MTVKVRIEGRVQGVGFRAFVASLACEYGVHGEVWNTRDGAVEAILQSRDRAILDDVVERLRRGPGRVDRISSATAEGVDQLDEFVITYTR